MIDRASYIVEPFERRRLLSVTLDSGVINVLPDSETPAADDVSVTIFKHVYRVVRNDVQFEFASADVQSIYIETGGGDDQISVEGFVNTVVVAADGNDTVIGGGEKDTLSGGKGNDSIFGGGDDDLISGDAGNDMLGGGSELYDDNDGDDVLQGGVGQDTADYTARTDDLRINLAAGTSIGADEQDSLASIENVLGGAADDEITGDAVSNLLVGGRGNDTLAGGVGNDTLVANYFRAGHIEQDVVLGEAGSDFIFVEDDQPDIIIGGNSSGDFFRIQPGLDYVQAAVFAGQLTHPELEIMDPQAPVDEVSAAAKAFPAADAPTDITVLNGSTLKIFGGDGTDFIQVRQRGAALIVTRNDATDEFAFTGIRKIFIDAGGGDDSIRLQRTDGTQAVRVRAQIIAGEGADTALGGARGDTIFGDGGNDQIEGAAGNDSLIGGLGDDVISGGSGLDLLNGGDKTFTADSDGNDILSGGAGEDIVDYRFRTANLNLSLDNVTNDGQGGETDNIGSNIEDLFSGTGDDLITGNGARNVLCAGDGNDTIHAGGGNDILWGSRKMDDLFGETGNDFIISKDGTADQIHPGAEAMNFLQRDEIDVVNS